MRRRAIGVVCRHAIQSMYASVAQVRGHSTYKAQLDVPTPHAIAAPEMHFVGVDLDNWFERDGTAGRTVGQRWTEQVHRASLLHGAFSNTPSMHRRRDERHPRRAACARQRSRTGPRCSRIRADPGGHGSPVDCLDHAATRRASALYGLPPSRDCGASVTSDPRIDKAQLNRRVAALASERTSLFTRAGAMTGGLDAKDQTRLSSIEREIDECFLALREQRAVRDAERFTHEDPTFRRALKRRTET
jgi:hypothetical protein